MEVASTSTRNNSEEATSSPVERSIVSSMKSKLQARLDVPAIANMYKVPPNVRGDSVSPFEPIFISIGPYYRRKRRLEYTQHLKWRYLQDLVNRSPSSNTINEYVKQVYKQDERAREQYYFLEEEINNSGEFVEMLVLDGCFLVEFFLKRAQQRLPGPFHVKWYLPLLRRDLCLLENQIPFFILETIYSYSQLPLPPGVVEDDCPSCLLDYVMHYIAKKKAKEMVEYIINLREAPYHLLHLFYLCELKDFKQPIANNESSPNQRPAPRAIPGATKLRKAGVKLQMVERNCRLKVSFTAGVLEIPFLAIQQDTITKFLNLVAFEQCCATGNGRPFTSYCIFLDDIIDTAEDVALLEKHKIIESKLGSAEDVARLVNGICRGTASNYDTHYLADLFRQVNDYHDSKLNRWIAELR